MAQSCQYKGCNVPAEAGSKFCIFHDLGPKDLDKFKRALSAQINEDGPAESRNARFHFQEYVFPTGIAVGIQQEDEDALVWLPNIEGNVSFEGALIKGDAKFSGAKMGGGARFGGVQIEGSAWFDGAQIKGDASFNAAKITGSAWFMSAQIGGSAMFMGAIIGQSASFNAAKITRTVLFMHAKIEQTISFREAKIGQGVGFDYAQIGGDALFRSVQIRGNARFDGAQIEGCARFTPPSDCSSLYLGLNEPRIRGWGDKRCGISITDARSAASFWRFVQRIFSKMGEREKADAAFYFERLNRWRVLRQNKTNAYETWVKRLSKNWIIRPVYWVLFLLDLLFVRWTIAYGASVARLFFTWFLVIGGLGITFSMVPRLIERAGGAQVWSLRNWIVGFHYSVTTFATLGLGRIGPGSSRLGMVLTSIEATLGAVLIALAVLVIGRRFMRQG